MKNYVHSVAYRCGFGGSTPLKKFRSFDEAEPNYQFRGKYIRDNLIRIRVSLICKIEWNPWVGGYCPQTPFLSALCPELNLLNPSPEQNYWVRHCVHL
jgi:hypothetical protein